MFCCNRSNEKSNRSGLGSGQVQIPGRWTRGAKLTDQKVILTDNFDRQSVNFENPVQTAILIRSLIFFFFFISRRFSTIEGVK